MFLLTGIVFGIKNFPGVSEDHMVWLIGIYTTVYGVAMFCLAKLDGKFSYNRLLLAGYLV